MHIRNISTGITSNQIPCEIMSIFRSIWLSVHALLLIFQNYAMTYQNSTDEFLVATTSRTQMEEL